MNFLSTIFFGVHKPQFIPNTQGVLDSLSDKRGIFTGDNVITWGRNLSFFDDPKFVEAWRGNIDDAVEEAIVWRTAVLAWAARSVVARGIPGDFVESGCYKGTSARILCDYLDFQDLPRDYYLYDLFVHDDSMPHHEMPLHGNGLYERVCRRFEAFPNVHVLQGRIPEVLHQASPEKIAFMHVDLNNAVAEIGTLEVLFDRLSPGGIMVLDDYGWQWYRGQKLAEDAWLAGRGYQVLELPTGQGLLFK